MHGDSFTPILFAWRGCSLPGKPGRGEVGTTQPHWNPLFLLNFKVCLWLAHFCAHCGNTLPCPTVPTVFVTTLVVSAYGPECKDIPDSVSANLLSWLPSLLSSTHSKPGNNCVSRSALHPAKHGNLASIPEYIYLYIWCACVCVYVCTQLLKSSRADAQGHVLFISWSLFYHFVLCVISQKERAQLTLYCLLPWSKPG